MEVNTPHKICPACESENEASALECRKCGAILNDFPTDVVAVPDLASLPTQDEASFIDTALIPEDGIGIHIPGAPKAYYLHIYKELTIGRPADATFDSVLDLSELGAYAMGVSRRHIKIRRTATGYEVIDLDSRNGTWLNSQRLVPNKPYPLGSGAELRIGKMRMLIVFRTSPNKKSNR